MTINENTNKLIELGTKALSEKKAEKVTILDIRSISSIADYMIVASGNNVNQLQAMADELSEVLSKEGIKPLSYEGYDKANWILLDYTDVIFHLFDKESREFYNLERLYKDAKIVEF